MRLIEKGDSRYFEQSCTKPYDRHVYRLHTVNGRQFDIEDYTQLQATWFQNPKQFLSHVEVLDPE
jgi:hypothetical protein